MTGDDPESEDEDISAWDPSVLPPLYPGVAEEDATSEPAQADGRDSNEPPHSQRATDELVLLATDSMRARRRPLAIAALWGWQVILAGFVALPAATLVASFYGRHPLGDAPLWQPGGLPLVDLLVRAQGARRETLTIAGIVFLVAGFADLFPLGALLTSMAYVTRGLRAPPMRSVFAHASGIFTTLATLFAMSALAEGFLVIVALTASSYVATATQARLGDARADQTGWLVALAVLGIATTVGVLHDLARAGAVRFRVRALRAWRLGFNAFTRSPASVVWSWTWRALAGWVPVGIGALVSARLGGRGGAQLVALFFVHQLVLAVRVAFRASWLAKALRAVDRAHRVVATRRGPAANSDRRSGISSAPRA